MSDDIILLSSKGATNFVGWRGKVYAVPQNLGACNDSTWSHPQVKVYDSLEAAHADWLITPPPMQASAGSGPPVFSLRQLQAKLMKVVTVRTSEIEFQDGGPKYLYMFRDDDGFKFMWSTGDIRYEFHPVDNLAEADHVDFLCPLCFAKNGGIKRTHGVMVSFAGRNIPDDAGSRDSTGKPSRWNVGGTGLDDLVLTPSILLDASQPPDRGCHWHGFVGSNGIPPGHAG